MNKQALKGFIYSISKSRTGHETTQAAPGQINPSIKGFTMVVGDKARAALCLPEKYKLGSSWSRYTTKNLLGLFKQIACIDSVLDFDIAKSLYGKDVLFVKLKVSVKKAYEILGIEDDEEDTLEYIKYLDTEAKNKDNCVGYELFLKQQATLAEVIEEDSSLDKRIIENWLTVCTSFTDNRVFHPITNWKKSLRKEYFPHESDLKASQINFLSALIRRTSGRSPFTDLVDTCRKEKKDVYLALAKKCGKGNLNRSQAKKYILKSLFDKNANWIWEDEGYQATLEMLKKTNEWLDYERNQWVIFYEGEKRFLSAQELDRKFEKLYIRKWLTSMELGFMTLAAKLLSNQKVKFITVHDCFAFRDKPTKLVKDMLDSLAKDFGCEFSHE